MAEFPALPLFTDAYLADTRHLTAAQHGAYLLLLMMAWRLPDCCLPDDDEKLARWAAMDARTWRNNKAEIMAFWHRSEDGRFFQKRLNDERKRVEQRRQSNIQAGRASALKRHERGSTVVITDVQPETNEPLTLTRKKEEEANASSSARAKKPAEPDPAFESFWHLFPTQRRGSKAKALNAWLRAMREGRSTAEQIQRAVEAYRDSDEVARGYAKGCEAWLNDDRWTVDYGTKPQPAPAPKAANQQPDYFTRTIEASQRALKNIEKGQP